MVGNVAERTRTKHHRTKEGAACHVCGGSVFGGAVGTHAFFKEKKEFSLRSWEKNAAVGFRVFIAP